MSESENTRRHPRRAILLDHTAALGGGEIALLNLVKALDPARYQPVVILFAQGPLVGRLQAVGCQVCIVPLDKAVGAARKDSLGAGSVLSPARMWKSLQFILRLRRQLRQWRRQPGGAAVVHCNSLKSDLLGGIAGRLARLPVVWHVRDRIVPEYLPGKVVRVFRGLCRWIPRYLVTNSVSTMETLALPPSYMKESRRACVVHDGVEVALAEHGTTETGINGDETAAGSADAAPLHIGIVGRISPWKGQHIFLQAAAQIREKFPQARFRVIGAALFDEAAYASEIQALTDQLQLRPVVEFTGFRPDVLALINGLDVLVHASTIGEPFGQVVAEGMAAGKPVIATRGGGVPEIVTDGESGLLVPMGDAPALATALQRLCGDAALRARLGAAGRKRIQERFTIQRTARGIMDVWDRMAT